MSRAIQRTPHQAFTRSMLQASFWALAAFSVAAKDPGFFVLTMLGVWIAWLFSVRDHKPAPRLVINTILLLVVAVAGIEMLRSGVGVASFAVFAALLLIVKMLDLRDPRDSGQVLVLTVSIVIAAILTSNSLITGVLMVVACASLLRSVVLYQMYWASSQSGDASIQINPLARIDIRSILLATGFLCALLGTLIFIVLPRNLGSEAFGQWGQAGGSVSGFADAVELDRPGLISSSLVPVLDLTITDRNGKNIGSENSPAVYLRGAVLYEYTNGDWRKGSAMQNPLTSRTQLVPAHSTFKPRDKEQELAWDQQFNISVRSSQSGQVYLFTPWRTVEFKVGSEPMRVGLDFRRGIFVKDGMGGKLEYSVRSAISEVVDLSSKAPQVRSPVTPTQIEPEIHQLASRILRDAGINPDQKQRNIQEDQAAVRLFERYLRTQYDYSLEVLPVPEGEEATRWFLFDRKAGHCEYFASALALMTRSVGIPARVITGYVVSDFNPVTGQYVVRESNAHAWIESEIAPGVWKTFDGTPRADFHAIHEPDPSLFRSISKFYESIEFLWVRTVVGYDSVSRQSFLGENSGDFGLTRFVDTLMRRFAIGRDRLIIHGLVVAGITFAGSMFIGMLMLKYQSVIQGIVDWFVALIARVRRRASRKNQAHQHDAWGLVEHLLHRQLEHLEIPKPAWKPLKEHLGEHEQVLGTLALPARRAILHASSMLYEHRFSPDAQDPDPQRVQAMEDQLRESEKSLPTSK